jgi:hypothetical protein
VIGLEVPVPVNEPGLDMTVYEVAPDIAVNATDAFAFPAVAVGATISDGRPASALLYFNCPVLIPEFLIRVIAT